MKRILRGTLLVAGVVAVAGFLVFLYLIPPFFIAAPETFSAPMATAAPPVDGITDPAERAIAARGRYIVMAHGCVGCHATPTAQGPDLGRYLAGGLKFVETTGTYVSRNLTPDADTGLARRTDEAVKRMLRSGVSRDGHIAPYTMMPWASFSKWTEEDRHAVVVYLRHLTPVRHAIPEPVLKATPLKNHAIEEAYAFSDYGGDK